MGEPSKNTDDVAESLQSIVKLNALERMTQDLDKELNDSQTIMSELKAIYDTVSDVQNSRPRQANNGSRHEDISTFLDAGLSNLLMPDMAEKQIDVNIDEAVATMKVYIKGLKKSVKSRHPPISKSPNFIKLELIQYTQSLDLLNRRVAKVAMIKRDDLNRRNAELEGKLNQLCDDVVKYTTVFQAKMAMTETYNDPEQDERHTLEYESLIRTMLSDINEVLYLLHNRN